MRGLVLVGALTACHAAPTPPPPQLERAAPPIDAAVAVVDPPPILDAAPDLRSDVERLPPSGEPALAVPPSEVDVDARYALAVQHAGEPIGLSLLRDIAVAAGGRALDRARWDDAWAAQWDTDVLRTIVTMPELVEAEPEDETAPIACAAGTKRKHDEDTEWCERKDGVKHGRYRHIGGDPDSDAGLSRESGEYVDGKKEGLWESSWENDGSWERGAYVHDHEHGLWEVGGYTDVDYQVLVDGKWHGRVISVSRDDASIVIREEHYDHGVLDGPFFERDEEEPFDLERSGAWDHGKQTGEWKTYDYAGRLRSIQHWDAGVANGAFVYYDADGKVLAEHTIDHGTGAWVEYDDKGLVAEGQLVAAVKQGVWSERARHEPTSWRGTYLDGQRDGTWTLFDEAGATLQIVTIKAGKLVEVNGKKPTKAQRSAFGSWKDYAPELLE